MEAEADAAEAEAAAEATDEDFDFDDATGDILDFFFGFGSGVGGVGCGITTSFFGLPFFVMFSFSHFQVSLFRTIPSLHFKTHLPVIGFRS
jgi:hypothetical protein